MDESVFKIGSEELFSIRESNDGERHIVEVHLRELPDVEQWQDVFDSIKAVLGGGFDVCQMRMERLAYCDSQGLGMLVTLDAAARNHGTKCEFWIRRESHFQKVLEVTRLNKILEILYI